MSGTALGPPSNQQGAEGWGSLGNAEKTLLQPGVLGKASLTRGNQY